MKPFYRTSLQEEQEGDYLIVTTETPSNTGKKDIIVENLKDLKLEPGRDFEVYVLPPADKSTEVSKVLISIRIPQEIFNKTAEEI